MRTFLTAFGVLALICSSVPTLFAQNGPVTAAAAPSAPTSAEIETLQTTVKTFFETISDETAGPQKGLEELLKNSPLVREEKEKTISALSNNIREIGRRFGAYLSFEPIGVKTIGRDLVVLRYLYKCQDYPVVWYFTFYRPIAPAPSDGLAVRPWSLIHFYYDSNLNIQTWENY